MKNRVTITAKITPRMISETTVHLVMALVSAFSAALRKNSSSGARSVKNRVTPYWPSSANGIAVATAMSGSMSSVQAKIAAMMPPMTALGGWAPPIGMLPMVMSWYVPPTIRPVFTSPRMAPMMAPVTMGWYSDSRKSN